ncbi:Protein kinase domain [Fusarium oxysporum f. sp. vasinfectum]|uniref:non-specific serine/threonine protein kinase n=1 Tax=Fusarium oxysporum f. sp. vasinfectum 25433 TaxID=1089449 RepID=X0L5B7_FUSOX|nr:CMGC/SRPK protein kinase [Fusarium oxysporum f. sp. vasinfectum 25433]KAK2672924.1 Protein kinase domain [Fusarium oxysporum f. sp. vasinfectum]KAK2929340.1 Protein kinase domain [Fusarium oxysporum f. sp. vasinfectum]
MASFLRKIPWPSRAWKPLTFSNPNFQRVPVEQRIEEELFPNYVASRYYPVRIGEVLWGRYQVVGKLGFGASSTVWLARDLNGRLHVALKLFINSQSMGQQLDNELEMYNRISASSTKHPGRSAVRELLDSFDVTGPDGSHRCLVHPPLWESIWTFLNRNPVGRLPPVVLAVTLRRLFLALDYLHTECKEELSDPTPRKEVDGRTIYISRELRKPKDYGAPVLCDFGSAVPGDVEHREDIQPDIYRAPEVILQAPWSYKVDIWNAGCMIWDIFEGRHMFTGHDPEFQKYRSRAHLAEIIALLGQPPSEVLQAGKASHKFFTDTGDFRNEIDIPERTSLAQQEISLEGERKEMFLAMMNRMLQWDPAQRSSAKELAEDPWIMAYM